MKNTLIAFLLLILSSTNLMAQGVGCQGCGNGGSGSGNATEGSDDLSFPSISAFASPTASSMVTVEQIPIDFYNGTVSPSIPLYNFNYYSHNIPITLTYQSTGLRVQERAGWVGLGWAIQAGGVVTRTVYGLPDDEAGGNGFIQKETVLSQGINDIDDRVLLENIADGEYDSQPDIFRVSTPTFSGEFAFINGAFRFRSSNKVKIQYTTNTGSYLIQTFTITDESGIKYYFSTKESSKVVDLSPSGRPIQNYTSSWFLTSIENPSINLKVYFDYQTVSSASSITTTAQGRRIYKNGNPVKCGDLSDDFFESKIKTTTDGVYLTKIRGESPTNSFYVNFILESRTDLPNEKRLGQIEVFESGQKKKVIDFDYGYFGSGLNTRLKLNGIKDLNSTEEKDLPGHSFEYYSGTMPSYDDLGIDFWGYYNGASNTNLVPTAYTNGDTGVLIYSSSTNRSPSIEAKSSMLKKVKYPTGGSVTFNYSLNEYGSVRNVAQSSSTAAGGLKVASTYYHDGVQTANDIVKSYDYDLSNSSGLSSGRIEGKPIQVTYAERLYGSANNVEVWCGYYDISPGSFFSIGDYSSNHIGYMEVTETSSTTDQFGKNIYGFEKHTYRNRGTLNNSKVYKKDGTQKLQSITSKSNSYTSTGHMTTGYSVERKIHTTHIGPTIIDDTVYVINSHGIHSTLDVLLSQTTKSYNSESDFVESTDSFTYNGSPNLVSKVTRSSENTGTQEKIYTYANSFYGTQMNNLNMYSQIYSITIKNGAGTTLGKSFVTWDDSISGAPPGKWLPYEKKIWDGNSNITVSKIAKYNSFGKPIEVQDVNNNVTKYYFGSNSNPFSQDGLNGISGVYLTGIQRQYGTLDNIIGGIRPTSGDDLFTEAEYDVLGRVNKLVDNNEEESKFIYDSYNRLISKINHNGFVTSSNGYGYSASRNSGVFSSSDPNNIEQITYIDPLYTTDFSSSTGWSSVTSHNEFNIQYAGEKTVKMGTSNGEYQTMYKSLGQTDLTVRVDFYPDNTTAGTPHIYLDSGVNRFAVIYSHTSDSFQIQYKINNGNYTYPFDFPLDAPPNQWYTIELQKSGEELTAWVYQKGDGRDKVNSYTKTGFSENWIPQFRLTGNDDHYYAANLSIAKSSQSSISYIDGLGREIQTQLRGGTKVIATETLYNERGLPEVVSRPLETTAAAFPGFYDDGLLSGGNSFTPGDSILSGAPVYDYYTLYQTTNDDEEYAYSYTQYEASPLARVEKSTLPGEDHQTVAVQAVTATYGLNTTETFATSAQGSVPAKTWVANTLNKTTSKDPDGNQAITYTNGWGQTIASGVDMNDDDKLSRTTGGDLVTEFAYDLRGNLVRVEDPRGLATTYSYNTLGQLISKQLPDQLVGTTKYPHTYKYDNKGRLRFHRNPNLDAASDHYYYTKYDDLDRPTEVGIRTSSADFDDDSDINNQSFPTTNKTVYITYSYDGNNPYTGHTPNNTKGRLTKVVYKDPNSSYSVVTYYSYNTLGLVEWVIQQPAQPTTSNNRKIEYSYDELGRMTRLYFNPLSGSSDDHYFWYYYDELGRLEKVTSYGSNAEGSALTEAEYTYYADGQVEQLKLGDGAQIIDYDYTIQGWLEDINNGTASGSDQFGMVLDYKNNGNISQQQWSQAAFSTGTYNYFYDYDPANRLKKACYGSTNECTSTGDYDVTYDYDDNGNIDFISRNGAGSEPDYDYTFTFESGTNKINSVGVDGISGETQTQYKQFDYDASGNVTQNEVQGVATDGVGITSVTYDWRNLPTSLSANGSTLTYLYDADGNRVKKQIGSTITWYVRGADGQTIAAYDASGNLLFLNILAGGQIIGQIEN